MYVELLLELRALSVPSDVLKYPWASGFEL